VTVSGADGTDEARPATAPVVPRLHRAALIEDRVPPSLIVGCAGMAGVSVSCRLLVMVRQAGYVSWPAPLLARPLRVAQLSDLAGQGHARDNRGRRAQPRAAYRSRRRRPAGSCCPNSMKATLLSTGSGSPCPAPDKRRHHRIGDGTVRSTDPRL